MHGRVVASSTELRSFLRDAVSEVYRYALALTGSPARAEQLTVEAAVRLARHVDAVGAAPVSATRLTLAVRREVLDSRPRRRRRSHPAGDRNPGDRREVTGSGALAALDLLSPDERLALVLRHHDGLLLPDIAAALGRSHAEIEPILQRAREIVLPAARRFDDGSGADIIGRLLRAVPGPPDALADRVWATVDAALVPEYAGDGAHAPNGASAPSGLAWVGPSESISIDHEVTPVREAKRNGVTLLVGAAVLGAVLGVAALTAPRGRSASEPAASPDATAISATTVSVAPSSSTLPPRPGRAGLPAAVPDVVVDVASVPPHPPDQTMTISGPGATRPFVEPGSELPGVSMRVRILDNVTSIVVRRPDPEGGSTVWLVRVRGQIRESSSRAPDQLQGWAISSGGVVMALRVAGRPDELVLVGLRAGGGGTWLRAVNGTQPLTARADGSVLCMVPGQAGPLLSTYQVLN